MTKIIYIFTFILICLNGVFAQVENIQDAVALLKAGNLDEAKLKIDEATKHVTTANNVKTWYYKGVIYKDIYKQKEANTPNSIYRLEAVTALKKCIKLDSFNTYTESAAGSLKYLASKYYNDAANLLNKEELELSSKCFVEFKDIMTFIDIDPTELKSKEIEYQLVSGSAYTKMYYAATDSVKRNEYLEKAKQNFLIVLKADPRNLKANYNMGVLYYNEAVNIISNMNYDVDLMSLNSLEDNSIVLFKKSLPYMETAFEADPENKNTIEGLAGIYFSLKEFDKSDELQKKLKETK